MGTQESPDDTQMVKDIKAAIVQELVKRYANVRVTVYMSSAVDLLDLRFKEVPFLSEAETSELYSRLLWLCQRSNRM